MTDRTPLLDGSYRQHQTAEPLGESVGSTETNTSLEDRLIGGRLSSGGNSAKNLFSGMAILAQVGTALFALTVWYVLAKSDGGLFVWHPAMMVLGLVLLTQGVLTLQPTKTPEEKKIGQTQHASFQSLSLLAFIAGATVILYNKISHDAPNFTSWHGKFGLLTLILLVTQAIIGLLMLYAPSLLGGTSEAKKLWKYHRMSGYVALLLAIGTAFLGTQSDWMKMPANYSPTHDILYAVGAALIAVGLVTRIRWSKMKVM